MIRIVILLVGFISLAACSRPNVQSLLDKGFQENGRKAIRLFSKAIAMAPQSVEAYWRRGHEYYELEQYEKAIEDYSQAIQIDSAFNAGYLFGDRASAKHELKDYQGAVNDFTIALRLCNTTEPSTPRENFYYYRSISRLALEDTLAAVTDLDSALYYWNEFTHARLWRARIKIEQGAYTEALEDYQACECFDSTMEREEYASDYFYYGLAKLKTGDTTYCPQWQIALKYKYPGVIEYILKYCKVE